MHDESVKKNKKKTLWIWLYALVLIWQIKQTEALLTLQRRCRSSGGSSVKVQLSSGWPLPGSGIKCLFLQRRIQRAWSCECRTNPVWMLLPCHCLCVCVCVYILVNVCVWNEEEGTGQRWLSHLIRSRLWMVLSGRNLDFHFNSHQVCLEGTKHWLREVTFTAGATDGPQHFHGFEAWLGSGLEEDVDWKKKKERKKDQRLWYKWNLDTNQKRNNK